jgi:hypothetical protein
MILPSKHLKNCESLMGLASILINEIDKTISIEELWDKFEKINNTEKCPTFHSFDNFVLSIDLLFLLDKVQLFENKLAKI